MTDSIPINTVELKNFPLMTKKKLNNFVFIDAVNGVFRKQYWYISVSNLPFANSGVVTVAAVSDIADALRKSAAS